MIKLIATDMDGTLLNSKKEFPNELFDVIDQLHKQNIKFSVAKWRQYYTLLKDFELVKDEMIFICENGALVFDQEKIFFVIAYHTNTIVQLIEIIRKIEHAYPILCGVKSAYIENSTESI